MLSIVDEVAPLCRFCPKMSARNFVEKSCGENVGQNFGSTILSQLSNHYLGGKKFGPPQNLGASISEALS